MRHFVIGDIHGHADAVAAILNCVTPAVTDRITFLGDYVDRGPDSRGVIDHILSLHCQVDAVLGNHDAMLLASVDDPEVERHWLMYGGEATLRSFNVNRAHKIPKTYLQWLAERPLYIETNVDIFCHAGVNPDLPMENQNTDVLLWRHNRVPIYHCSGKRTVCGHTPITQPVISSNWISLDTNISNGGPLSCYELHSNRIYQADRFGLILQEAA